jgi:lysyl-tRNA synthetase class 2
MSELEEQIRVRREKRERLRAEGVELYPARVTYDLEPADVHARFGERSAEELQAAATRLTVPGRVRSLREHGKTVFLDLHDGRQKLQALVRRDKLPADSLRLLEALDLGDLIAASGPLIRTRTGELTLQADGLVLLAKALRPMPEKWHGLADVEARYRQRYLDLMVNPDSRRVFETRARIVRGIRDFLDRRGFIEVETPMLQMIPTGATARPFRTHHNTLDLDLFLRIAPELFLKRLTVGGLHKVYEINRNFRNEGISTQHNPEFTMLEFYWAYANYRDLMALTEEMFAELAQSIHGTLTLPWKDGRLELASPWARFTVREAIVQFGGLSAAELESPAGIAAALSARGCELPIGFDARRPWDAQEGAFGHLLMALFEVVAEEHLIQPTFITDYPVEVSPLSKQRPDDPRFTERFELYLGGMEVANAFSELNDPDVQAERFLAQVRNRERGDQEAHPFDADYVRALEHGMPPAAGEGVGIDRLTMLLTDSHSIRDVILFPLLRPEAPRASSSETDPPGSKPLV